MATSTPVKLMLLGIGVLLFGIVFPSTLEPLILRLLIPANRFATEHLIASILPLVGFVLIVLGFFKKAA